MRLNLNIAKKNFFWKIEDVLKKFLFFYKQMVKNNVYYKNLNVLRFIIMPVSLKISVQNLKSIGWLHFELHVPAREKIRFEKNPFKVFVQQKLCSEILTALKAQSAIPGPYSPAKHFWPFCCWNVMLTSRQQQMSYL